MLIVLITPIHLHVILVFTHTKQLCSVGPRGARGPYPRPLEHPALRVPGCEEQVQHTTDTLNGTGGSI